MQHLNSRQLMRVWFVAAAIVAIPCEVFADSPTTSVTSVVEGVVCVFSLPQTNCTLGSHVMVTLVVSNASETGRTLERWFDSDLAIATLAVQNLQTSEILNRTVHDDGRLGGWTWTGLSSKGVTSFRNSISHLYSIPEGSYSVSARIRIPSTNALLKFATVDTELIYFEVHREAEEKPVVPNESPEPHLPKLGSRFVRNNSSAAQTPATSQAVASALPTNDAKNLTARQKIGGGILIALIALLLSILLHAKARQKRSSSK